MKVDYSGLYWMQRAVLLASINKKLGTPKNKYFMNGDGSISARYLRPTKGWKWNRVLSPTDTGHWLLNR